MFLFRRFVVCASLAILVLLSACDDRGRNIPTAEGSSSTLSGIFPDQHVFSSDGTVPPQLLTQLRNRFALADMTVYQPEVIFNPGRPVPVLLLLPPEGGNENYYLDRGLERLADEMIASGEIQPMLIITIENDPTFGGFFYGNSWPAGFYDQVFGYGMLDYLATKYPGLNLAVADQQKFGVGGLGQGAYGAFRAAIQNPGLFGSITVLDGPLDFDGSTGSGGLIPLMDLQHVLGLHFPFLGGTATASITVTGALALVSFVVIQIHGFRELGVKGYLEHLCGGLVPGPIYLAPVVVIVFVVEVAGQFIKPAALAIRLFANMVAGHTLMAVLLGFGAMAASKGLSGFGIGGVTLISGVAAVAITFLELFVAFLQAFIFMFLTAVFISLMSHHDEEHDEHDHDHESALHAVVEPTAP